MKKDRAIKRDRAAAKDGNRMTATYTTRARLAAIVEGCEDAVVALDPDGIITDWNRGAERIFGYATDEIVGTSVRRLIPADRRGEADAVSARVLRGERTRPYDTVGLAKDRGPIDVSITISPIGDENGAIVGVSIIARDITAQKGQERELARMTRLYAALSQINQAIVWKRTRAELFDKICEVLLEHGGFELAWIGWIDPATQRILPVAAHGIEKDYLKTVEVYGDDRPQGRGPTGEAYRTGKPYICNDLRHNPVTLPWRAQLAERGFQSSASFPIREMGNVRGALSVYAQDPWYFAEKEVALLSEAAGDICFAIDTIAEREARQALEMVAESERQFSETMIESMPGILYLYDSKGRHLRWNRNFEEVTGYSGEEISHMRPLDLITGEDRELIRRRIAEVFAKGESFAEAALSTKDGRRIPYFFTGRRVVFNDALCMVGMGIDISERRAAEQELNETRLQLESVIEDLREGLVIADDQRGNLRWNPASLRMLGFEDIEEGRRRQLEFDRVFELFALDETKLSPLRWPLARVRRGEPVDNLELRVRRIGSSWERIFSYSGSLRSYAGGRRIAFMTMRDITEQKRARMALETMNQKLEQEVENRTRDLQSALDRAESADRVKSAFLATMSHELRTPLNTIIGFTGVLYQGLSGPLNSEQSKQLGMVRRSARHLLDLINDVLDISKIEAEQLEVRFEAFPLSNAIESVAETMKEAAVRKGLSFEVRTRQGPGGIVSDQRRVEQILLNLLSNAVKFTDQGGVSVQVERVADHRFRSTDRPRPAVRMRVSDTGPGIRPEDMESLFEPFKQLVGGTERKHEGTGLGLAICRRLAELLGGELLVESVWQKGSDFTLVLPCERDKRL